MKTANVLFDGLTIQYTPNIFIEICKDPDEDETLYDVHTSDKIKYNMTELTQAHAYALKAMAKEAASD